MRHPFVGSNATFLAAAAALLFVAPSPFQAQDGFRFRTGVELVTVTATVTDPSGRFVPGLKQSDFLVYEDDRQVEIAQFTAERTPVSLGIVLDTSGSMAGQKIVAARAALDRFLFELLGPDDEVFLYRFDTTPHLVTGWTTDRTRIGAELRQVQPDGATALYDAVAEALPLLRSGRHSKKALLIISDGLDTSSHIDLPTLKQLIRESEALVYAIGMGGQITLKPVTGNSPGGGDVLYQRRRPPTLPFPIPGRRPPPSNPPIPGIPPVTGAPRPPKTPPPSEPANTDVRPDHERSNVAALRDITDETGGRTQILRDTRDLDVATAFIADELSRQYSLAYRSPGHRDGRWHSIRVEVRDRSLRVRARAGYTAAS